MLSNSSQAKDQSVLRLVRRGGYTLPCHMLRSGCKYFFWLPNAASTPGVSVCVCVVKKPLKLSCSTPGGVPFNIRRTTHLKMFWRIAAIRCEKLLFETSAGERPLANGGHRFEKQHFQNWPTDNLTVNELKMVNMLAIERFMSKYSHQYRCVGNCSGLHVCLSVHTRCSSGETYCEKGHNTMIINSTMSLYAKLINHLSTP